MARARVIVRGRHHKEAVRAGRGTLVVHAPDWSGAGGPLTGEFR